MKNILIMKVVVRNYKANRKLLTTTSDNFSLPTTSIRSIGNTISNATTNNNSNSFNFNIDRVVVDKNTNIKQTAKQFTVMCQREGIFK